MRLKLGYKRKMVNGELEYTCQICGEEFTGIMARRAVRIHIHEHELNSPSVAELVSLLKRVETALNMLPNEVVNRETRETSYDVAADISKVINKMGVK